MVRGRFRAFEWAATAAAALHVSQWIRSQSDELTE